ncbi:MAG: hypothetical protein B7Z08_06895, partial [Sphingomonadales bacterium 32-68-7]
MKTSAWSLACIGLLGYTAPVAAAEGPTAAPRGDWTLVSRSELCSLQRQFGDEGDLQLRMDTFGSRTNFQFTVTGKLVPFKRGSGTDIRLAFTPDSVMREKFPVVHGQIGSRASVTFPTGFFPVLSTIDQALLAPGQRTPAQRAELDRIGLEFVRGVTDISIEFPLREPLKILTGSMAEPLARLRACVDKLNVKWGLDPEARRTFIRDSAPLPETFAAARQAL